MMKRIDGVDIVNTTPHSIRFQASSGDLVEIEPDPGILISARPVEEEVGRRGGATLVCTRFVGTDEGRAVLDRLERDFPGAMIVGSIIAAQAYPGRVVAMAPAPGFERVPPAEKRMRPDRFTVFPAV